MVEGAGFEPAKHEAADLQSAGFDHSPTPPQIKIAAILEPAIHLVNFIYYIYYPWLV